MAIKIPQRWISSGQYDDGIAKTGRRYIPSPEKIRQWAMDSREGGRFRCPGCKCSFSVTYSYFGSSGKPFEEATFWCRDCVKANENFRRVK
jgi:hypothetical protein